MVVVGAEYTSGRIRLSPLTKWAASSLLALPGCGELTAAKLIGEAAGVGRFKSEAAFARHAGVAPIPVWSGNTAGRMRMTWSGNRRLNTALHRIAVTQIRLPGLGRTCYRKRAAGGDSNTEALRCLKRRLARIVFQAPSHRPRAATHALPNGGGLT